MLALKKYNGSIGSRDVYEGEFKTLEVEGVAELEVLCPISKVTGWRMSMQQAIFMITDKNSRLADVLFQELPPVLQDESMDDNDKLKMLVSRLDSGSFAENDKVAEILGDIAKEFFPDADVEKVVVDSTNKISFAENQEQVVENV